MISTLGAIHADPDGARFGNGFKKPDFISELLADLSKVFFL